MNYAFTLLLSIVSLSFPPESPVKWISETTIDAGDVIYDEDLLVVFRFKNITDAPLLIDNVRAGCGCTATDWVGAPVMPGDTGSINVTYDAMNVGYFRKNVKVFFNGYRGGHKLYLEGFVED